VLAQSIIGIAIAPIPDGEPVIKEVALRIENNLGLISDCAASLLKKTPFDLKSKDGFVSCVVPKTIDKLLLSVAVGDTFLSRVSLPTPAPL